MTTHDDIPGRDGYYSFYAKYLKVLRCALLEQKWQVSSHTKAHKKFLGNISWNTVSIIISGEGSVSVHTMLQISISDILGQDSLSQTPIQPRNVNRKTGNATQFYIKTIKVLLLDF